MRVCVLVRIFFCKSDSLLLLQNLQQELEIVKQQIQKQIEQSNHLTVSLSIVLSLAQWRIQDFSDGRAHIWFWKRDVTKTTFYFT